LYYDPARKYSIQFQIFSGRFYPPPSAFAYTAWRPNNKSKRPGSSEQKAAAFSSEQPEHEIAPNYAVSGRRAPS
jgi:hypothetical protein